MAANVDAITSQLVTLSPEDLSKIKSVADTLLQGNEDQPTVIVTKDETLLFDAIRKELENIGVGIPMSLHKFSQTKSFKPWKNGYNEIQRFLQQHFRPYAKTRNQRYALYRIFIQTIIQYQKKRHIPVSAGTIIRDMNRIHQTFDSSFPSYLECGLAFMIPKALLRSQQV